MNRKKNDNRSHGFRIPLISNLLPTSNDNDCDSHSNLNRRQTTLREKFRMKKNKHKKRKFVDIVLGFRGTDSSVNVKLDLKFKRVVISPSFWYELDLDDGHETLRKCVRRCIVNYNENNNNNPLNLPTMKIHSGFYEAFKDIRQHLLQTVIGKYYDILQKRKVPGFYITGHSLGGALAQLCGLWFDVLFGDRSEIHIYVYGCPRVGDFTFSQLMSGRIKHLYRIVFEEI